MALLPPSTNSDYRGSTLSAWFVVFTGVMSIIPGCIHYFLPDGGAGVIANMDLSTRGQTIIALFAWFGALQIPHGIGQLIIGLRYRSLVPLTLALAIIERVLLTLDAFFLKGAGTNHPPGHYGSVVALVLSVIFLILSLRERRA
jgi:hypothetical protein